MNLLVFNLSSGYNNRSGTILHRKIIKYKETRSDKFGKFGNFVNPEKKHLKNICDLGLEFNKPV